MFLAVSALLFAASVAVTVHWCGSMATGCGCGMDVAGACPLAGSMWLPAPGQGCSAVAAGFLAMWTVMMTAMMLPSLVPLLWRYRQAVGAAAVGPQLGRLTALVGAGYFSVWILAGMVAFPLGAVSSMAIRALPGLADLVPLAVGVTVLAAGILQLTRWKARQLACCRATSACDQTPAADAGAAWWYGLRLGSHCVRCCAGSTVALLAIGMMDLRVMAAVTLAITLERLAPAGGHIARVIGAGTVVTGLVLLARAGGLA
jgi:predicted metal-binding membrane protein